MKLRTSFFNSRVLLKNLARFAPVWILYTVAEVLGLMSINVQNPGLVADDLALVMGPVSIFHAGYAFLVAACLFGDLFDSRLCNGLHAMPMRREGWLLTNLVSGLVFALIPAVVGAAFAAVILKQFFWVGLLWQGTSLLQFVFFFGVAVFSAMCAGKRLGMAAIYGILNFLSMLIFWVVDTIFEPLLPGVVLSDDWFSLFCPVVSMVGDTYVDFYWDSVYGGSVRGFVAQDWNYLYICACVGIVFTLLSWLRYRKRHLETAGDFISFRPMKVFFLLTYTLAMGALLFSFMGQFLGLKSDYGFLVAGIVIGWFTSWMLLERTVKIFNKKVFLGFVAFSLFFAGCIGLTKLDPFGVVSYVPKGEDVAYACLYPTNERYYYYAEEGYEGRHITDQAELERVLQLHQKMIETPDETNTVTINMDIRYRLKSGKNVCRTYNIPAQGQIAEELETFLSDMRFVFLTEDVKQIWESVNYAHVYLLTDDMGQKDIEIRDRETLDALLTAIEADCRAGVFAQHDYFHTEQEYIAGLDVTWQLNKGTDNTPTTRNKHMVIYSDCHNMMAFLETLKET